MDKVFVSFGSAHAYFWTIMVYGGIPSIHKAAEEIDKCPYHSQGKTLREELADIPRGARAGDKDRVRACPNIGSFVTTPNDFKCFSTAVVVLPGASACSRALVAS